MENEEWVNKIVKLPSKLKRDLEIIAREHPTRRMNLQDLILEVLTDYHKGYASVIEHIEEARMELAEMEGGDDLP